MILDPEDIPTQIKDQIEAASNDLGKGFVAIVAGPDVPNEDERVLLLAQAFNRALTSLAMMIL